MNLGKIAVEDLIILLDALPHLENDFFEVRNLANIKRDNLFKNKHLPFAWCKLYEFEFNEHLARVVVALGLNDELRQMVQSGSPIRTATLNIKDMLENIDQEPFFQFNDEELPYIPSILGLGISLYMSLKCLMTYGLYLNDLILISSHQDRIRADKAIFQALKIDPTVIGCESVVRRISEAVITDDKKFLKNFKSSLNGSLTKREQKTYQDIRLVLQVLVESKAPQLNSDDLYKLFVEQLKIVAKDNNSDSGDVSNNLRQFAYQFMKSRTVS